MFSLEQSFSTAQFELTAVLFNLTAINSPIDKREIELQRLQFALRACLRKKRHAEAAKLAFKAGGETAGDSRQQKLLQQNTDLVAALLESSNVQEIAFGRRFAGTWLGCQYAYEACLLSYIDQFKGDARSRLRMAHEWLLNWSSLPKQQREKESVEYQDVAAMVLAEFNIHGSDACAKELSAWTSRIVSFRVGRIISRQLIDHGKYADLDSLAISAKNNLCLLLAIALELRTVRRAMPAQAAERALRLLQRIKPGSVPVFDFHLEEELTLSIASIVEQAFIHKLDSNEALAGILDKILPHDPPRALTSHYDDRRFSFLCAYTIRAALRGENLQVEDLAYPELREQFRAQKPYYESSELREFKACVGSVLPWHKLRAERLVSSSAQTNLPASIADMCSASSTAFNADYQENRDTTNEIAKLWFDILISCSDDDRSLLNGFNNWFATLRRPLFTTTWTSLARTAARTPGFEAVAYEFCKRAFELTNSTTMECESRSDTYVQCARALLSLDKHESKEFFNQAVGVASKFGDEVFPRWEAMMGMANRAGQSEEKSSETAYRFARCAEVAKKYVYDHFNWDGVFAGSCVLSF